MKVGEVKRLLATVSNDCLVLVAEDSLEVSTPDVQTVDNSLAMPPCPACRKAECFGGECLKIKDGDCAPSLERPRNCETHGMLPLYPDGLCTEGKKGAKRI